MNIIYTFDICFIYSKDYYIILIDNTLKRNNSKAINVNNNKIN